MFVERWTVRDAIPVALAAAVMLVAFHGPVAQGGGRGQAVPAPSPLAGPSAEGGSAGSDGWIQPGVAVDGCTLNFIFTNGTDFFALTAGHCYDTGERAWSPGIGVIGTVVFSDFGDPEPPYGDWAFIHVDEADEDRVNGTLKRWGGPSSDVTGEPIRDPRPGDPVVYYGQGWEYRTPEERARRGTVVSPRGYFLPDEDEFTMLGPGGPGDSGAPILTATGQAAGIISAAIDEPCEVCPYPDEKVPNVVLAHKVSHAEAHFESWLGEDVRIVEGSFDATRLAPNGAP